MQDNADGNTDGGMDEGQPMLHKIIRNDQQRRGMIRLVIAKIGHALAYGVKRQLMKEHPVNDAKAQRDQACGAQIIIFSVGR